MNSSASSVFPHEGVKTPDTQTQTSSRGSQTELGSVGPGPVCACSNHDPVITSSQHSPEREKKSAHLVVMIYLAQASCLLQVRPAESGSRIIEMPASARQHQAG